jgi:cytochrome o ubiquinol oxidase subunit IV
MTPLQGSQETAPGQEASVLRRTLRLFLLVAAALTLIDTLARFVRTEAERVRVEKERLRRDRFEDGRSYLIGAASAIFLTLIPFGMVYWSWLSGFWLYVALGSLALTQVIVHFRYFLHIRLSRQKKEDLQLILFSSFIVLLMAGGTVWIFGNLAGRMH